MRAVARTGDDRGFGLLEAVMATAVIGILMAGLSVFFVRSMVLVDRQGDAQAAVRVAADASEHVRALRGPALPTGRDAATTAAQWSTAPAAVDGWERTVEKVWDPDAAAGAGAGAPLPSTPQEVQRDGVTYRLDYYLGACRQLRADPQAPCTAAGPPQPATVLYRVIITVSWPGCATGPCFYATSLLVGATDAEPFFD